MRTPGAFDLKANLASLVRPTGSTFYAHVDGWRALSILWIMAFHALVYNVKDESSYDLLLRRPQYSLMASGTLAVDLFFVISGFLIGGMLLDELHSTGRLDVKRFYLRRAARLLPVYYVVMGVMLALPTRNHASVWSNLLYVNNYVPYATQFMSWAWSLAVEEQFYLAVPWVIVAVPRRGLGPLLLASAVLWVAVRASGVAALDPDPAARLHWTADTSAFESWWDQLYQPTHMRFGGLSLGLLAASALREDGLRRWFSAARVRVPAGTAAVLLVVVPFVANPFDLPFFVPYGAFLVWFRPCLCLGASMLLLLGATGTGATHRLLAGPAWRPIARLSYGAYLVNPIAANVLYDHWPADAHDTSAILIRAGFSVLLTLAVALVLYLGVERPCMNLRSSNGRGR